MVVGFERRDDHRLRGLIEHQLEAAHVAPVRLARSGAIVAGSVSDLSSARGAAPGHRAKGYHNDFFNVVMSETDGLLPSGDQSAGVPHAPSESPNRPRSGRKHRPVR